MIVRPKDMGRFSQCPKVYEMQSSCQVVVRWPWGTFLPAFRASRTGPSNFFDVPSGGLLWVGTSMSLFLLVTSVSGPNPPPNLLLATFRPSLFPDVLSPMLVLILLVFCQWMVSTLSWIASPRQYTWSLYPASPLLNWWQNWDTSSDYMDFPKDIVFDRGPNSPPGSWRLSATWLGPLPVSHWTLVIRAEGFSIVIGLRMALGSVHGCRPALSWTPLSSEISIAIILDGQVPVRWPRSLGLKGRSTHLFFTQTLFPSCKELRSPCLCQQPLTSGAISVIQHCSFLHPGSACRSLVTPVPKLLLACRVLLK